MTKQEFQKRIGAEISQKDYSIVEHVYTWHPSISEVEGKEQIAELYKSFGMPIIKNMMEAANYAETLDRAMAQAQRQVLDRHNAEMEAAKAADEDGTGFLYQMFKYELDNHEYGYTGELEDTLDCLGLTWEELKASPVMLKALDKASTEIREREGWIVL